MVLKTAFSTTIARERHILPTQLDTIEQVDSIPLAGADAQFVIEYVYSCFFPDWHSWCTIPATIRRQLEETSE